MIKNKLWIILLIGVFNRSNGQQSNIAISYNHTKYNGKIGVHYERTITKKVNIILGLSYRMNENYYFGYIKPMNIVTPDEMAVFYKFYSKNLVDKLCLRFGVSKGFSIPKALCDWRAFYDAQIGTSSFEIIMGGFDSSGAAYAGLPFPYSIQDCPILEQHLGVTCSFKLNEKLNFTNSFGLGITSVFNIPKHLFRSDVSSAIPGIFNFTYMLNSGLTYNLSKSKKFRR